MNRSECENVAKKSRISGTSQNKMGVILGMEDGETRPDVCRSVEQPPLPLSTIKKDAGKINAVNVTQMTLAEVN